MAKTLANSYLFSKYPDYEKQMLNFIMTGEMIDTTTPEFEDVRYEVKRRQVSNYLAKILESKNLILINGVPMQKSFKVFAAKDIKGDKKLKIFIDCSGLIEKKDGKYMCNNVDILIAYLVSAACNMIYYTSEERLIMNNTLCVTGATCYSAMFTYIIDYLFKISTVGNTKDKVTYLSSMFYLVNILGKKPEQAESVAKKISGLTDREVDIINIQANDTTLTSIKFFIDSLIEIFKFDKLTLDIIIEKWMFLYGTGTVFGLELFPSFSAAITDAYVGCYVNNQKTIEKVTGRNMVEYTKTLLQLGADMI
jgi:hypothetical protein